MTRFSVTAAGILSAGSLARASSTTRPDFDPTKPERFRAAIRGLYAIGERRTYLNTAGLGPVSIPVLEKTSRVRDSLQREAESGRHDWTAFRQTTASFLGAEPAEVAFTRNATEGNSIIAAGLSLKAGDEVIFESHAHPGGSFPWLNRQLLAGIRVRIFEPSSESAEESIERIRRLITPRTRVIQLSHITAPTGIHLPVKAVSEIAQEADIWFHIDAAQSVGAIPIDVHDLGCDSLATSGHKWLGAPHETGVLYIRRERLPEVALSHAGAYSDDGYKLPDQFKVGKTAGRFEYGTRDAGAVAGVAEACLLQEQIGRDIIAAHGRRLGELAATELGQIPGVKVISPRQADLRTAITTFRIGTSDCHEVFGTLLREFKLRCRPVTEQGLNAVRISPHIFNTEEEIEQLIRAVDTVARRLS